MKQDLVLVRSKTMERGRVPVVWKTITLSMGDWNDERELSASYVFENFQCEMPLNHAKILVKENPKEFFLDKALEEFSKTNQRALKAQQEKFIGFKCDICGMEAKSRAGLLSHNRRWHTAKVSEVKNEETTVSNDQQNTEQA